MFVGEPKNEIVKIKICNLYILLSYGSKLFGGKLVV